MGVKWIELVFRQRSISQSKLYRDVVKPAGREAAIEMPQSWNDHSDDRDVDIEPRLIEDEEVNVLILSDRGVKREFAAVPALLAVSGLHHYLIREGLQRHDGGGLRVRRGGPTENHQCSQHGNARLDQDSVLLPSRARRGGSILPQDLQEFSNVLRFVFT